MCCWRLGAYNAFGTTGRATIDLGQEGPISSGEQTLRPKHKPDGDPRSQNAVCAERGQKMAGRMGPGRRGEGVKMNLSYGEEIEMGDVGSAIHSRRSLRPTSEA